MIKELESDFTNYNGKSYPRLAQKVFNLVNKKSMSEFLNWKEIDLTVHGTDEIIKYLPETRIPIGVSHIGTSRAISLGSYAFALKSL